MVFKYCPMCQHELKERHRDGRMRQECGRCGFVNYENPLPAAAVVLTRNDEILLVRRKFEPRSGDWTLPAGFVERDETAEQAAMREAKEETGLDVRLSGLLQVFGSCETTELPIILIVYCGWIVGGHLQAGDDAEEARFFALNRLPDNIAFSNHRRAIETFKMKETFCCNSITSPLDRLTS